MMQKEIRLQKLARLLEIAAKKQNESADATCAVAFHLGESDEQLEDELFDNIFDKVAELARLSLDKKPEYERAARGLLAKSRMRVKSA
jgi:uncharacterized Fe-S center protein